PAVLLVVTLEAPRRDGVGEGKEPDLGPSRGSKLSLQRLVLAFQHREQPLARHVARSVSVALVAERLVVGADRLGDGTRGRPGAEDPVGDLLSRADLGERAVAARVEVDLERLAVRTRVRLGNLSWCSGHLRLLISAVETGSQDPSLHLPLLPAG